MKFSLTLETLMSVRDGALPCVMWSFYLAYSEHVKNSQQTISHRDFDRSLPRGLRLVHSVVRFDSDILNGGIAQYIGNHTRNGNPDEVFEDLEALETIGANESAAILREAISVATRDFGWPTWSKKSCACEFWEHSDIERLDDIRCNDKSSGRDYSLLDKYLRQFLDECILPVEVESADVDMWLSGSNSP